MPKLLIIWGLLLGLAAAQNPILPLAHWRLDETAGTTAFDSGPFSNDGTLVSFATPTWTSGQLGGALDFDGTDDYVDCATNFALPIYATGGPFTISFWVNGPAQADRRVFSEGSSVNNTPLFTLGSGTGSNAAKLRMYVRDDGGTQLERNSVTDVFDGAWHHVAYADDGAGNARVFVDGALDLASFDYPRNGTFSNMDRVSIGAVLRATACCFLQGSIDDVRIFDFGLNAGNVNEIMIDGLLLDGYQVSPTGAALALGASTATRAGPATATVAQGANVSLTLSSDRSGMPWDLFVSANPTAPAVLTVGPGAIVNIGVGSAVPINGVFASAFGPPPLLPGLGAGSGSFTTTLTYTAPASALNLSMQFVVLDPTSPNGLHISGAGEVEVP